MSLPNSAWATMPGCVSMAAIYTSTRTTPTEITRQEVVLHLLLEAICQPSYCRHYSDLSAVRPYHVHVSSLWSYLFGDCRGVWYKLCSSLVTFHQPNVRWHVENVATERPAQKYDFLFEWISFNFYVESNTDLRTTLFSRALYTSVSIGSI